jgi:hypothetical protein
MVNLGDMLEVLARNAGKKYGQEILTRSWQLLKPNDP